ncbi:hypothetical protein GGR10_001007 [Bartonella chomelii]|uniref:Uncharacterized protein n=1 Tax=Bartonella chomelii TaxID=236402 RepID=A0ABR6E3P0_9HYPH|nr:hypothetical protein [Bartonella chomelii]
MLSSALHSTYYGEVFSIFSLITLELLVPIVYLLWVIVFM